METKTYLFDVAKTEDKENWHEWRRQGIGGSDAAAVLGLSKPGWSTPLDVYLDKRGEKERSEPTLRQRLGNELEPIVLNLAEERLGSDIVNRQAWCIHAEHDWMRCTLDGQTGSAIVQAKTSSTMDGWGEDGSDDIPIYYQVQVQHEMAVTGLVMAYVPVLFNLSEFRIYVIPRDNEAIEAIIAAEQSFWFNHVVPGIPPEPQTKNDTLKMFPKDKGTEIKADHFLVERVDRLREVKALIKDAEAEEDIIGNEICRYMRDASILVHPDTGKPLVTWKASKDSTKTDWESYATFADPNGTLKDQFTTTKPGSRRFLVK